jgi:hypothetical protein
METDGRPSCIKCYSPDTELYVADGGNRWKSCNACGYEWQITGMDTYDRADDHDDDEEQTDLWDFT